MLNKQQTHLQNLAPPGLVAGLSVLLLGCWHVPRATVDVPAPPHIIQEGIGVESAASPVTVQTVDTQFRTLAILPPGETDPVQFRGSLDPKDFARIGPGSRLRADLRRELTVFVSKDRQLPQAALLSGARVLEADPSYRVLTVEYPDGRRESFKVNRGVRLDQMTSGDDVAFRTIEVSRVSLP